MTYRIKLFYLVFISILFSGCTNYALKPKLNIQYFESIDSAPEFEHVGVVESYGAVEFMKMPTFEEALAEAQYKAKDMGANAVIFLKSVRAIDIVDDKIDITKYVLALSLGERNGKKAHDYIQDNQAEDQLVWYFIVANIKKS